MAGMVPARLEPLDPVAMIPETLAHLVVPLESLRPHPRNVREGDVGAISESLRLHGLYRPLVVNQRDSTILAGNHTYAAARALGWREIAVTYVDVDDEEAIRIMLIDNRTNDLATNDTAALVALLRELPTLEGSGYDGDALDELLSDLTGQPPLPDPEPDPGLARSITFPHEAAAAAYDSLVQTLCERDPATKGHGARLFRFLQSPGLHDALLIYDPEENE